MYHLACMGESKDKAGMQLKFILEKGKDTT